MKVGKVFDCSKTPAHCEDSTNCVCCYKLYADEVKYQVTCLILVFAARSAGKLQRSSDLSWLFDLGGETASTCKNNVYQQNLFAPFYAF